MEEFKTFCHLLDAYLRKRFNYKAELVVPSKPVTNVMVNRVQVELYLRYKTELEFYYPNTLVIASIGYRERRKGHGTSLLEFIISISHQLGIEHIAIEHASTEAIKTFASKYGFNQIKGSKNHYTISIKDLRKNLSHHQRTGFIN